MIRPASCFAPAAVLLLAAVCQGQRAPRADEPAPLRVDVNLVVIPVTVTDKYGQTLSRLPRTSFHLFEEGVSQSIATFSSGDAPVSIGLILDVSGSMRDNLPAACLFIRSLLAKANPDDEASFLTLADRPDVRTPLTRDLDSLDRRIRSARPGGSTSLIDAVYGALDHMKAARNSRKALLIVSDGQDNHSRYSKAELMSRAAESDAQIYALAINPPLGIDKPIQRVDQARGVALLDGLARTTGGLCFEVTPYSGTSEAIPIVDLALHHQYLLGYYAGKSERTGWRRVQVKVDLPNARLFSRNRYFAPSP